jgi:putative ATP-dependent endonuclease of OLD family
MKLERVVIKNFRSIEHVEFTFPKSGFLVLVGANNAGKSNIIRAIDAMCGDQWFSRDKVENHDHYLRDRSRPIEIKLGFSDRSYAEWRSDGDRRYPTLYDSSGRSLFGGPQPKDAFPCIYLGADRTFDRHMAFWDWTLIGKIRKQFNLKAKPVERELREKFDEVVKVFDKIHGFPQFKKDFARFFQEMQADTDAKLNIDFKPYTPSNYFKTMQIVAQDADIGDEKFDLEELGEGSRNMVLLALLRSYATNFRSATDDHGGIIALEEPELYMHPQARRHMSKVLREIAEAGMQVR